jgi:hypothetical protein
MLSGFRDRLLQKDVVVVMMMIMIMILILPYCVCGGLAAE